MRAELPLGPCSPLARLVDAWVCRGLVIVCGATLVAACGDIEPAGHAGSTPGGSPAGLAGGAQPTTPILSPDSTATSASATPPIIPCGTPPGTGPDGACIADCHCSDVSFGRLYSYAAVRGHGNDKQKRVSGPGPTRFAVVVASVVPTVVKTQRHPDFIDGRVVYDQPWGEVTLAYVARLLRVDPTWIGERFDSQLPGCFPTRALTAGDTEAEAYVAANPTYCPWLFRGEPVFSGSPYIFYGSSFAFPTKLYPMKDNLFLAKDSLMGADMTLDQLVTWCQTYDPTAAVINPAPTPGDCKDCPVVP